MDVGFNPRPCARGDGRPGAALVPDLVSIHAPARGATRAPRRSGITSTRFNPRPCARGDLGGLGDKHLGIVSIHAPARGATSSGPGGASGAGFQSTPLREGRPVMPYYTVGTNLFQSTPLREGRRQSFVAAATSLSFNPRPCARGDASRSSPPRPRRVSIHAPARGATRQSSADRRLSQSFNPRPCARGDAEQLCRVPQCQVSIHAPARGATGSHSGLSRDAQVSIHAPARGATRTTRSWRSSCVVSIHAPARGATRVSRTPIRRPKCFNPRPCARGDFGGGSGVLPGGFQSTPLREGRPPALVSCCPRPRFNPRPCARGDHRGQGSQDGQPVSIHAPARGATREAEKEGAKMKFQSTPLREGRRNVVQRIG